MKTKEELSKQLLPHVKTWDCYNDKPDPGHETAALDIATEYAAEMAKGFLDWAWENRWYNKENGIWHYTFEMGTSISKKTLEKHYRKTTADLYKEYINQQK